MPRRPPKHALQEERAFREQTELDALQLRMQLERLKGERRPLYRHESEAWRGHFQCGNIVFAGRRNCGRCHKPRSDGYTFAGSVRGVPQITPASRAARNNGTCLDTVDSTAVPLPAGRTVPHQLMGAPRT